MAVFSGQRLTAQLLSDNSRHLIPGGYAANASTTTTLSTGAEIVFASTGSVTLRNGRAYEFTVSALVMANSADRARIFVKRTSTTGPVLLDTQQIAADLSASNGRKGYTNIATNQTGADITGVVVATIQRSSGTTTTVSAAASSTSPAYFEIEDIGPATDYPSATPIS